MSVCDAIEVETTPTVIDVTTTVTDVVEVLEARGPQGPEGPPGTPGDLTSKAGSAILAAFDSAGVATVTFSDPFPDTAYSVGFVAVSTSRSYAPAVRNKTAAGFEIHLCSSQLSGLVEVTWSAFAHGSEL